MKLIRVWEWETIIVVFFVSLFVQSVSAESQEKTERIAATTPQVLGATKENNVPDKRPNIVFLIADDERWDMMSCSGNKYLKTPNRDKLAAEGMRFRNAFVTSAVCSPSRGSFLTGKHVHQCGTQPIIHMNHTFHRNERPFPAQLHDIGYHAAHFGKWHLGEGDKRKPGYDHWVGYYALTHFFDPTLTINDSTPHRFHMQRMKSEQCCNQSAFP